MRRNDNSYRINSAFTTKLNKHSRETDLGIHVREEGAKVLEERLPPVGRGGVVEGAGRRAAGPLGRVVVGRGRGRGRYELVGEDGGPLAAHYGRHGGPCRLAAPPIRPPPLAAVLLVPAAGVAHHLARRGPAGAPLLQRSTAEQGSGLGSDACAFRLFLVEAEADATAKWSGLVIGSGTVVWFGNLFVFFF